MVPQDTDRNLLLGVLALQGGFIESAQFVEACSAWAAVKDRPLGAILHARGWISADDERLLLELAERRINRHEGNARQSLLAAAQETKGAAATLGQVPAAVDDPGLLETLAGIEKTKGFSLISSLNERTAATDRYTLTTLHAKGGVGQVWMAHDESLDREVAFKELRPERSHNTALVERFVREAAITGKLDHPGVVPIYEFGKTAKPGQPERPYYTMRFIRGRTLSQAAADYHIKRAAGSAKRTDLLELIQAFVDVCHTVAFAHSRGVIHRDLKGLNVVMGEFGEVIVLDWGLAKHVDESGTISEIDARDLDPAATAIWANAETFEAGLTSAGEVLGTPAFMAPEQAEGKLELIGKRTDVYGLGAMLYEILAGKPPFDGESTRDVLRKVREEPPAPPRSTNKSAPRGLEAVCLKAMAKQPGDRYESVSQLADEVQHWLADEPISAYREPWTETLRRWINRNRTTAGIMAGVAVIAFAALGAISAVQARSNKALKESLERETQLRTIASDDSRRAEQTVEAFYSGVMGDEMLRRPELEGLRNNLLRQALNFYETRVNELESPWRGADPNKLSGIAGGLGRIASIQAVLGERDKAIETRRKLIEILARSEKPDPYTIANAFLELGNLERLAGKPESAEKSLREALRRFEEANRPISAALVRADLGRLLFDSGKSDEAHQLLKRAEVDQEKLSTPPNRGNVPVRGNLAATLSTLGNAYEAEARYTEAAEFYEKAVAFFAELRAALPNDPFYAVEYARALNNLGIAKARNGRIDEGRADVEKGLALREQRLAAQPLNVEYRADLARSYYHLARIESIANRPAEALKAIEKAAELYAGIPPKGPEDLYFQACMKAMNGALVDDEASNRLGDEALDLLKRAATQGYGNIARISNENAFDALRARPEFQALLRGLADQSK